MRNSRDDFPQDSYFNVEGPRVVGRMIVRNGNPLATSVFYGSRMAIRCYHELLLETHITPHSVVSLSPCEFGMDLRNLVLDGLKASLVYVSASDSAVAGVPKLFMEQVHKSRLPTHYPEKVDHIVIYRDWVEKLHLELFVVSPYRGNRVVISDKGL